MIERAQKEISIYKSNNSDRDLAGLKNSIEVLLNSLPASASNKNLKNTGNFYNKRFAIQIIIIAVFAALSGYTIYLGNIEQQKEKQEKEQREAERLKSEGIAQAQAEAIAAQKAAALRAMEKPLPQSGVYRSKFGAPESDWPPLKIENEPGANALIKLVRVSDGVEVISVFVRSGDTVEVNVPLGSYRGKIASGQIWYGDKIRFGPDTSYGEFESIFDFNVEGNRLAGKELTLRQIPNGNLHRSTIDAGNF